MTSTQVGLGFPDLADANTSQGNSWENILNPLSSNFWVLDRASDQIQKKGLAEAKAGKPRMLGLSAELIQAQVLHL